MGATFTFKVKHRGGTPKRYKEVDYKGNVHVLSNFVKTRLQEELINTEAKMICEEADVQKLRSCFLAAVFFQRVCARTPVDEGYTKTEYHGVPINPVHYPDDDYVRDAWKAKCNGRTVSAKTLRHEYGIFFETFNDEKEINAIFNVFRERFLNSPRAAKKHITINIENTHERFAMLEYGGYQKGSDGVKKGEWSDYTGGQGAHYHGLVNGFSVQAPYGMFRITEAEFQKMTLKTSTEYLIRNYVKRSQRAAKVPSKSKIKSLRNILGKRKLKDSDIEKVKEAYGI